MADFTTGHSDPLINTLLRERHTFWITNSHRSEDERQHLWSQRAAQICSILGMDSITSPHDRNGIPGRSLSFGGSSMIREPTNRDLPLAVDRPRDFSQQSAPAAVSMSRTTSRNSRNGNTLFTSNCGFVSPASTSSQGDSLSDWPINPDEPFSAYTFRTAPNLRRTASQRNTLPQLSEVDVYEDPSVYVSQLSETLPTAPSLACTPSPTLNRPTRRNQNLHRLSVSAERAQNFGNIYENSQSPTTPTTGELTNGTTLASEMSRQDSLAGSTFCGGFDLLRVHSNKSVNGEQSPVDVAQSFVGKSDNFATFVENDRSHFLRYAGGVGEDVPFCQSFPSSAVSAPGQSSGFISNDMKRSLSNESNSSASSCQSSRSYQRRQEQLVQGTRPIAPKLSDDEGDMSRRSSEQNLLRKPNSSSTTKLLPIHKTNSYVRPSHPKVMCKICNDHPEGFRGEHELRRHTDRAHKKVRKAWVTVDITAIARKSGIECPKVPLATCKACRNTKHYGAYYNAAAHLRRAHFNPRKRGRGSKGKDEEKRGGKGGGEKPPMDELKKWMREVTEFVDHDEPPNRDDEADDQREDDVSLEDGYNFTQSQQQLPYSTIADAQLPRDTSDVIQSYNINPMSFENVDPNVLLPISPTNDFYPNPADNSTSMLFADNSFATSQQSPFDTFEPFSYDLTNDSFVDPASFSSSFTFDVQQQQQQQQQQHDSAVAAAELEDPTLLFLGMQQ